MRTERLLRADGIIYGNVKGYYEDKHTYTFVINGKDIVFPKARYKLNKKDRYYDMDNRWNEDLLVRLEVKIMELAVHMKNNKTGEKRIKKVNGVDASDHKPVKDFYYGSEWKWTGTEPFKNVADKVEHIGKGYYKIKEN